METYDTHITFKNNPPKTNLGYQKNNWSFYFTIENSVHLGNPKILFLYQN